MQYENTWGPTMDQQDKSTVDSPDSVHPVQPGPGVVDLVQRPDGRWTANPDELIASAQCCGGACSGSIGSAAR